jgi:glucoside 3-dehydrogenase (cytochrome c) hitch-hiker subunit
MERRDLLRATGAAAALSVFGAPRDALAMWARVARGGAILGGLSEPQLALIGAVGDTILPRTDTPSATDVGVPAFVDVVVSENDSDEDRAAFVAGLDLIEARAKSAAGNAFAQLEPSARAAVIESIEAEQDRRAEPARTYWRLKGLIVHGYFTSEPVMKEVLKVEVMPGRFEGSAPMPVRASTPPGGGSHRHA